MHLTELMILEGKRKHSRIVKAQKTYESSGEKSIAIRDLFH